MNFVGSHILGVEQFSREDIARIFDVADSMAPYARRERVTRVLEGAILGNMFFEPSTRTRVSFGCAWNLLGGEVRETTGIKASALAKGESFYDTARVLCLSPSPCPPGKEWVLMHTLPALSSYPRRHPGLRSQMTKQTNKQREPQKRKGNGPCNRDPAKQTRSL